MALHGKRLSQSGIQSSALAGPRRLSVPTRRFDHGNPSSHIQHRHSRLIPRASPVDDEEEWEKEMSIFKQRIMRPNQLETLRELESKVNVGKVLYAQDDIAIIAGLNADAPLGTKLAFVSGATGVLMWHRSDNLAFAIIMGGASNVKAGEGVECKIRGVLQVIDETKGPITKKDYELVMAPAGDSLMGKVVDFLGREPGSSKLTGYEKVRPLVNQQVAMKNREQISEGLLTGVKALDTLTPLGRGSSLLVIGPQGCGKTTVALDAIIGQKGSQVTCVIASTGHSSQEEVDQLVKQLQQSGAMAHTTVVAAGPDATLGERYAALCTACSLGERVRDDGGHALVVLDDLRPLLQIWDEFVSALANLGQSTLREGLVKDSQGRDIDLSPQTEQELVDYEGMLVSGAVAQRRGFFSTLFLRAAKLAKVGGGGSMTLLPLIPGRPATGVSKRVDMSKYQTLSEEQKAKMQAVLEAKMKLEAALVQAGPNEMNTEAVEEFISISDGQLVLEEMQQQEGSSSSSSRYRANPKLSVTRIGTRAYYKAMEVLAPQVRLDLAQAEDARKFSLTPNDPILQKYDDYSRRLQAALLQPSGQPASLQQQVVTLYAIQQGFTAAVPPEQLGEFLDGAWQHVQQAAAPALREIADTKQLTATAEKGIADALAGYCKQQGAVAA